MAVFGKKPEGGSGGSGHDEQDFVRIPAGTRIAAGADGKLLMSFAGDMSFGEALPDLSEIGCGRNLSIDAGVTIRADSIKVKATLELEAGSRLLAKELEVDRLVSHKGHIEARTVSAGQVEIEGTRLVADRVTARDNVFIDRGEVEIGTVVAQSLTVTKGTIANILIAEVAKLDGAITKGGYENFAEFLAKVLLYHPEILNDRFSAEARKMAMGAMGEAGRTASPASAGTPSQAADGDEVDAQTVARLSQECQRLKSAYDGREMPREIAELIGWLQGSKLTEVRRNLTPIYQKLGTTGPIPDPVIQSFRAIQKVLSETEKRREARPA